MNTKADWLFLKNMYINLIKFIDKREEWEKINGILEI